MRGLLLLIAILFLLFSISYSATLNMTYYNKAPSSAFPADTVTLLQLRNESTAGTITIQKVKIDKQGDLADNYIEKAYLIHDVDNDGYYDTTDGILSSGTFSAATLTFDNVNFNVTYPTVKSLLIVYTLTSDAPFGKKFGVNIAATTYITVNSPHTVHFTNGPPFVSGDVYIANISVTADEQLAPTNVARGEEVVMGKLRFYVNKEVSPPESITKVGVTRIGAITDGDIKVVKLIHDFDNNGRYDTGETVLATGYFGQEYAGYVGFNINLQVTPANPQSVLIVYNIAADSKTSVSCGARITYDVNHINSANGIYRIRAFSTIEFKTIISKRLLVMGTPNSLILPNSVLPGETVVIDQLRLRIDKHISDGSSVTLNSITLSREGAGADSDVECVYIYTDNNSDGSILGETQWASKCNPAFTNGYSILNINQTLSANKDLLVVYKIAANPTTDIKIGMGIENTNYISVDAATKVEFAATLTDNATPGQNYVMSDSRLGVKCIGEILKVDLGTTDYEEVYISESAPCSWTTGKIQLSTSLKNSHSAGDIITTPNLFIRTSHLHDELTRVEICGKTKITAISKAPPEVQQGEKKVPILQLKFESTAGYATLNTIKITRTGGATSSDIDLIRVYNDSNGNGIIDGADQELATEKFTATEAVLSLGCNFMFSDTTPGYLLVAYDIATNAGGNTAGVKINSKGDITFCSNDSIDPSVTFPLQSSLTQIIGNKLIVSGSSLAPNYIRTNVQRVSMLQLMLTAEYGELTVSSITVKRTGDAALGSLSQIGIYDDSDGNGLVTDGETPLGGWGTDPGPGGSCTISLDSGYLIQSTQGSRQLVIAYDISAGASLEKTVGAEITNKNSIALKATTPSDSVKDFATISSSQTRITNNNYLIVSGRPGASPRHIKVQAQEVNMLVVLLKSYTGNITVDKIKVRGFSMNFDRNPNNNLNTNIDTVQFWLDTDNNGIKDIKMCESVFPAGGVYTCDYDIEVPKYSSSGDLRSVIIRYKFKSTLIEGNRVAVGISDSASYYEDGTVDPGIIVTGSDKIEPYGIIQCYDTVIGGNNLEVLGMGTVSNTDRFQQSQKKAFLKLKASASGPNTGPPPLELTGVDVALTGEVTTDALGTAYFYKDTNNNQTYDENDKKLSTAWVTYLIEAVAKNTTSIKVNSLKLKDEIIVKANDKLIIGKGTNVAEEVKVTSVVVANPPTQPYNIINLETALVNDHSINEIVTHKDILHFGNFTESVNFVVNGYTRLANDASKGLSIIEVESKDGLLAGDTIIVGKGLPNQETVKITGLASGNFVNITPALQYDHDAAEVVVEIGNEQYFFVVYTISPNAPGNKKIGAKITTTDFVKVKQPNTVSFITEPIESEQATIIGNKLYVTPTDYSPEKITPAQKILIEGLKFQLAQFDYDAGYKPKAIINSIKIDKKGDIQDSAIKVYLYQDTGNGLYDAGDILISSSNFTNGSITFSNLNSQIDITTPKVYFILYELSEDTKGITGLKIVNNSYFTIALPDEITSVNLPVQSKDILVRELLNAEGISQAPAKVSRSQKDAVMLKLNLTAQTGNMTVSRIKIKRIGTSQDSDVKEAKLFNDTNSNGSYDTSDTLLSTTAFKDTYGIFNPLNYQITKGTTKTLFIVYHIADQAQAGKTVGVELSSNYDIALVTSDTETTLYQDASSGSSIIKINKVDGIEANSILEFTEPRELTRVNTISCAVTTCDITLTTPLQYSHSTGEKIKEAGDETKDVGFPIYSSTSTIQEYDTLQIIGESIAPETATPLSTIGLEKIKLSAESSEIKVTGIKVKKKGTLNKQYIDKVKLYKDDGDGIFDKSKDSLLQETAFPDTEIATFTGLAINVHYTTPQIIFIAVSISSSSPLNETVGVELLNLNMNDGSQYIIVEQPDKLSEINTPSISSGLVTISEKDTLVVSCENLAPQYIMQGEEKDMIKLKFQTASGTITVTSIKIYEDGTSTKDADTEYVKLYNETINKQGQFVGQYITFKDLNIVVTADKSIELKIAYKVSTQATVGKTLKVKISNKDWITVLSPDIVSSSNFPLQSTAAEIKKGPVTITVTGESLAQDVYQGEKKAKFLKLIAKVTEGGGSTIIKKLIIKRIGTSSDSDITAVYLYKDNDLLDSATIQNSTASFEPLNLQITQTETNLFIYYDIAPSASIDKTVGVELSTTSYIELSSVDDIVKFTTTPITSQEVKITKMPDFVLVAGESLAPASLEQGQTNVPMEKLTLQLVQGSVDINVEKIKLKKSGSSTLDGDVAKVILYKDDSNGVYDTNDIIISSSTFTGGFVTFDNLNLELTTATGADKKILFVVYNIAQAAQVGRSVGVELTDNSFITVTSPDRVKVDNFPIKSNEPTIGGHTLTVEAEDLAPQEIRPQDKVAMLKLKLKTLSGDAIINKIKVKKIGTSTLDTDIEYVSLYDDSGVTVGTYDAGDALIATAAFDNAICSLSSDKFAKQIKVTTTVTNLFIIYKIYELTTTSVTVGAELTDNTFVEVLYPDTTQTFAAIKSTTSYIKDTIPPAAITDLVASPGAQTGEVKLTWTAPGDDANKGQAQYYIIKMGETQSWDNAIELQNNLVPQSAGSQEEFIVSNLEVGKVFYFAIKTVDDAGNISSISNWASTTAPDISPPVILHTPIRSIPVDSEIIPTLNIKAKVTDNKKVEYVKLFYKKYDEVSYKEAQMELVGEEYQYPIPQANITNKGLRYYIEAADSACNISFYDTRGVTTTTCGTKEIKIGEISPVTISAFTAFGGPHPLSYRDYLVIVMYHNKELPPATDCYITQNTKKEVKLIRVDKQDIIPPIFYLGSYEIQCADSSIATLTVNGYDIAHFTSVCLKAKQKATIESIDKKIKIEIPQEAFLQDIPITITRAYENSMKTSIVINEKSKAKFTSPIINNKLIYLGDAYHIGPVNIKSQKEIQLSIVYPEEIKDIDINKVGVYYFDGTNWIYLDSKLNKEEKLYEVGINQFYTYRLIADTIPPEIKNIESKSKNMLTCELSDTGSGINRETIIVKFDNNESNTWQYDDKEGKLNIDLTKLSSGLHNLYIGVKDKVNNSTNYEHTFFKPGPISIDRVYTLPNPVGRNEKIRFVYEVNTDPTWCEIEVYNIRGDLVKRIPNALSGATKQQLELGKIRYIYDATKELDFLSNGVYIYRVTVREADGHKATKINKLAIIK